MIAGTLHLEQLRDHHLAGMIAHLLHPLAGPGHPGSPSHCEGCPAKQKVAWVVLALQMPALLVPALLLLQRCCAVGGAVVRPPCLLWCCVYLPRCVHEDQMQVVGTLLRRVPPRSCMHAQQRVVPWWCLWLLCCRMHVVSP